MFTVQVPFVYSLVSTLRGFTNFAIVASTGGAAALPSDARLRPVQGFSRLFALIGPLVAFFALVKVSSICADRSMESRTLRPVATPSAGRVGFGGGRRIK